MDPDYALLDAWQAGDRGAGDRLLRRHVDALHRFFRNKVGDEVDELVQRSFLSLVRSKDDFRRESSFRTFVFTVARRQLFRYFERRRRGDRVDALGSASVVDLGASPSGVAAEREEERLVLLALRRIPLDLQIAIELHYWEGLTMQELADAQGIPTGTAKSRLRRAREALEGALAEVARSRAHLESTLSELDGWARSVRRLISPRQEAS